MNSEPTGVLSPEYQPITYDRLARVGLHRWWLPPVSTLAVAIGAALVLCAMYAAASGVGVLIGRASGSPLTPFADNVLTLLWLASLTPLVLIVARLVQRRPAGTLHSVTARIRWRWLAICSAAALVVAAVLWLVLIAMYGAFDEPVLTIGWARFLPVAGLLLILVPLQAAGEEYLARGFLLQSFGSYSRWIGVIVSSAIFAALHGFGGWAGFTALIVGATVWALLVIRTGGLEVSIAAHAATNLTAFLLAAAAGGLDVVDDNTAADATWPEAMLLLGADISYALIVLGLLRLLSRFRPALVPASHSHHPQPNSANASATLSAA